MKDMSHRFLASVLMMLSATAAFAQTAPSAGDAARREAEAREIRQAVAACDKGAAAPLDFTATAPPVHYFELFPADFDTTKLKALQAQCQTAWVAAPKEKRMHLQWLRSTIAIGEANIQLLTPQVRKLAKE